MPPKEGCRIIDRDQPEQLEAFDRLIQLIESNGGRVAQDGVVDKQEFSLWRRAGEGTNNWPSTMVRKWEMHATLR